MITRIKVLGLFTVYREKMAKKAAKIAKAVEEAKSDSYELVKSWAEDHACDRYTISSVGDAKYRVNLYKETGDIIRVSDLTRSFYLVVTDGMIEDKTIKKGS
jgi:hypothetical protein